MERSTRNRILVVDDEEDVREALGKILEKEDFEVETASGVDEALELAARKRFDLVITDLIMPTASGLTLLLRLRASKADLPVIVMTAYGNWDSYLEAMDLGVADYLTKPLKRDEIVGRVRSSLATKR